MAQRAERASGRGARAGAEAAAEEGRNRRGRPRSPRADRAIAAATVELLATKGFAALRIEHVAERAGVGKTTVYRRWATKEQLVAAALAAFGDDFPLPDTGDTRADLVAALRYQLGLLTAGFGRLAATVLSEAPFNPVLAAALRAPTRRRRDLLAAILEAGIARGELRPGLDLDHAVDLLWGPIYYRFLVSLIEEDDEVGAECVEPVVDDVLHAFSAAR